MWRTPATYLLPELQLGIGHAFAQASCTLPLNEVPGHEQVLMDGSGHHDNGEVRVHPDLAASVCQPSTRYARIPPGPLLKKGGSYPLEIQKRQLFVLRPGPRNCR
jgi:hypothetical protein